MITPELLVEDVSKTNHQLWISGVYDTRLQWLSPNTWGAKLAYVF